MRLLIIDGHALAYRAFYAIRELRSPSGRPTNAIYGFIKMLLRIEASIQPTHLVVIWDGGLDEQRLADLPDYKGQRDPMPDEMELQLDGITEWLDAAGMASLCDEGVEADDRIGQLAWAADAEGFEVVIASSDKDFMQLVNERIRLLNPGDKSGVLMDAAGVEVRTGVKPDQIVDWLSLVGDAVDNIPGVRGVGPKTATSLLQQFGSIDGIYRNLDQAGSVRLRGSLADSREKMKRNRDLVRLRDDLPGCPGLEEVRKGFEDGTRLEALYEGWGFRTMLKEQRELRQATLFE